jgi:hypothetical protein
LDLRVVDKSTAGWYLVYIEGFIVPPEAARESLNGGETPEAF